MGSKPFDNFGVTHWLTWLVSSKSIYTSSSQLENPYDTKALLFLPPSTHDLLPFHHHLSIVCVALQTTFVSLFTFLFLFLPHTTLDLNSSNINYHIHRVCFPKVHAIVHVMDITKYFIFLHTWKDGCLILWWWFPPLPPCFFCVCRVIDWDVLLEKRNLLQVEFKSRYFILKFWKKYGSSGWCTWKDHSDNQSM
jgi:hypothetical protein